MKYRMIVCCVVLLLAVTVGAGELYIPASAHSSGVGNTEWRTDLEVKARGNSSAAFKVELLKERRNNTQPLDASFSVEAGQSMRLVDLVNDVFGFDGTAALRITSTSGDLLVTSRTYNDDPEGTFGQFIPAFDAVDAAESGFDYALIQLSRSQSYRTNMGFLNASEFDILVDVDLYSAAGILLGSTQFPLRPYELWQETDIYERVTDDDVEAGFAVVRTQTEDARFFAYASVVDNNSGDPIFIPAQLDGPTAEEVMSRFVVFEGFMRDG